MKSLENKYHNPVSLWDKLLLTNQMLKSCELCEHRCKVDRTNYKSGYCGVTNKVYVHSEFLHFGIEYDLIPSYAIFFSGCSMRCVFCSSKMGLSPNYGIPLNPQAVAQRIDEAAKKGAKTVLLVGGEPSIHPQGILEIALYRESDIPLILDTNLYMTETFFDLVGGVINVYLADFKFGNDHCVQQLAGIPKYVDIIKRNLLLAQSNADLYIRHLLLPGHLKCCFQPIVDWISENLPNTKFHLVNSYEPAYLRQKQEVLNRKISDDELNRAQDYAQNRHLMLID